MKNFVSALFLVSALSTQAWSAQDPFAMADENRTVCYTLFHTNQGSLSISPTGSHARVELPTLTGDWTRDRFNHAGSLTTFVGMLTGQNPHIGGGPNPPLPRLSSLEVGLTIDSTGNAIRGDSISGYIDHIATPLVLLNRQPRLSVYLDIVYTAGINPPGVRFLNNLPREWVRHFSNPGVGNDHYVGGTRIVLKLNNPQL